MDGVQALTWRMNQKIEEGHRLRHHDDWKQTIPL